ncbi:hypothetical protein KK120_18555 [Virgibacillus dakarensis]|nr:hypothetical protein [Virgibacillus dakarensis]
MTEALNFTGNLGHDIGLLWGLTLTFILIWIGTMLIGSFIGTVVGHFTFVEYTDGTTDENQIFEWVTGFFINVGFFTSIILTFYLFSQFNLEKFFV